MDYRSFHAATRIQNQMRNKAEKRHDLAAELRRKAEKLRDEGQSAPEFWLAEQYEISARLLN